MDYFQEGMWKEAAYCCEFELPWDNTLKLVSWKSFILPSLYYLHHYITQGEEFSG